MSFTNIRFFFSKTGNARYISHLDLYRAMGRAIKRAGLSVWITEGFNPHIYMTFALPLALGIESQEESMDLRLIGETSAISAEDTCANDFADILGKFNAVMPQGIEVIRISAPVKKAAEIKKARYEVKARQPETLSSIYEYLSRDEIIITKKTKKNIQEIDVKPLLEWNNKSQVITLPAGNILNINPWNVLSEFDTVDVKRIAILCNDGSVFS